MDRQRARRGKVIALLAVLALMINLPVLDGWRRDRQLAAEGVDRTARVVEHSSKGGRPVLRYALEGSDTTYDVVMQQGAWEEAVNSGEVGVRVLPDAPMVRAVEGEASSHLALWLTLLGDLALLGFALLLWRSARYGRRRFTM